MPRSAARASAGVLAGVLLVGCGEATTASRSSSTVAVSDSVTSAPPVEATGLLGPGTHLGVTELRTAALSDQRRFYTEGVGLAVLAESATEVTLGAGEVPVLRLVESAGPADDPTQAGLYHNAFLFPDEKALAAALVRTATVEPTSFQGSADHLVSQAFYFGDPDGNGVELYVDRDRSTWVWSDGLVTMGSTALDPNAFVSQHLGTATPPAVAEALTMGHVHLRGGDLRTAEEFYTGVLGLSVTARSEGALFFSADGYHHHLAVNTWSSAGAGARPAALGLGSVTIVVADESELAALTQRVTAAGLPFESSPEAVDLQDPWGTVIRVELA